MNFDECDKIFARVRDAATASEVCHGLDALFANYELLNIEILSGSDYWRARLTGEHPWSFLNEMIYPPPEQAGLNRLNDRNVPCLYAAKCIETALQEIEVNEGDLVQLVGFRVKPEAGIRIAVIGELLHVYKRGYLNLTGIDPGGSIGKFLNGMDQWRAQQVLYIDAFLSKLLADENAKSDLYIRSRSIAAMIYRNMETDGIIFPSVRDPLGMNIALRPATVDSKMRAVCSIHVRITRIRAFGFIEYEVISEVERTLPDGRFSWVAPNSSLRRRYFNLTKKECETALHSSHDSNAS